MPQIAAARIRACYDAMELVRLKTLGATGAVRRVSADTDVTYGSAQGLRLHHPSPDRGAQVFKHDESRSDWSDPDLDQRRPRTRHRPPRRRKCAGPCCLFRRLSPQWPTNRRPRRRQIGLACPRPSASPLALQCGPNIPRRRHPAASPLSPPPSICALAPHKSCPTNPPPP